MIPLLSAAALAGSPTWEVEPFLRPEAGLSVWAGSSGSTTAISLGAVGGANYWQSGKPLPLLQGTARVRGAKVFGSGASGTDVRVGNFIGPAWKSVVIQTGPDVFWSEYQWGLTTLEPALGLAWPARVGTGLGPLSVTVGVEPAWFLSSERAAVDWSAQSLPGFGDELTYMSSVTLSLDPVRFSLSYTRTITAAGAQQGIGVGLKLSG